MASSISAHHIFSRNWPRSFTRKRNASGRSAWLAAESDRNDTHVIKPPAHGGYGVVDAQCHDDFHHSLHPALTGDTYGYFADFDGLPCLGKVTSDEFVYEGQRSGYRRRRHGHPSGGAVCRLHPEPRPSSQRLLGKPLIEVRTLEQEKLAAAVLLCSLSFPTVHGAAGFYYFTDHTDPALAEAVREDRRKEPLRS